MEKSTHTIKSRRYGGIKRPLDTDDRVEWGGYPHPCQVCKPHKLCESQWNLPHQIQARTMIQ
ncbi:hypothetical protein BABINDRAFT_159758 [Babjeviella inositovora NRRL Y-12698]|uniref:Uncharacterized protein n=1 Tax=Babjeviella inositovora NRRL Y-12698 TaxID=984486 RepID=A0A1E3QUY7_9ASCO|nr:uncharacterized protein BABINDRAFT_159758 [Babjeviella inositovora NRRL Y-12698]ODQ81478.1 hypothetical protein BABINDRAFT_159758 [Babjeviella inositovora NRRL Y-12698]